MEGHGKVEWNITRKGSYTTKGILPLEKKDVLAVTETCMILHNTVVRMSQEEAFEKNASEKGDFMDLVSHIYDKEESCAAKIRIEANKTREIKLIVVYKNKKTNLDGIQL